jgi:hypothetical protein
MLMEIGKRRDDEVAEGPVEALLACHQRIRHFTSLAAALATTPGASLQEIAEVARAVGRYFELALPLHAADEDLSVAPRLLARGADEPLWMALQTMSAQHVSSDATLVEALPLWRRVAADPAALAAQAARLGELARALAAHWEDHLGMEETIIFPAITARLDDAERAAMLAEMRARRASSRA